MSTGHGQLRRGQRLGIACKRPAAAAKQVARKLIEHQDQGEQRVGCRLPTLHLSVSSLSVQIEKARANRVVEFIRFPEPRLARFSELGRTDGPEPKIEYLAKIRHATTRS